MPLKVEKNHDNVPAHMSVLVNDFLVMNSMTTQRPHNLLTCLKLFVPVTSTDINFKGTMLS